MSLMNCIYIGQRHIQGWLRSVQYTRVQNMRKEWQEVLMSMKALSCEQKEKLNNVFEDMSTASYDLARSESE